MSACRSPSPPASVPPARSAPRESRGAARRARPSARRPRAATRRRPARPARAAARRARTALRRPAPAAARTRSARTAPRARRPPPRARRWRAPPRPPRATAARARAPARPPARAGRRAPGGARDRPGEVAGHQRAHHVARQPALGVVDHAPAQQLQRDDRDRLVQRQAVELVQRPVGAGGDQPRLGQRRLAAGGVRAPRHRKRQRARREPARGRTRAAHPRGRARAARRPAPPPAPRRGAPAVLPGRRRSAPARRSAPPARSATPSSPRSDRTTRSSRSCADSARRSTAYCSLTRCEKAFSVIAMNGSSYGTSKSGKPCTAAASRRADGTVLRAEPDAEAEPAEAVPDQALDVGPLVAELQPGGQQQLAAGQPRRRIGEL